MANNKIEVSFKLEDIPMIIETLEKIQNENEEYKQALLDIKEYIEKFNVFERFSFPLMKKWEENQVKSSIDYEFNTTVKKELLDIVNKALGDKEIEEIPQFKGTLEQLDNLTILGDKENRGE